MNYLKDDPASLAQLREAHLYACKALRELASLTYEPDYCVRFKLLRTRMLRQLPPENGVLPEAYWHIVPDLLERIFEILTDSYHREWLKHTSKPDKACAELTNFACEYFTYSSDYEKAQGLE